MEISVSSISTLTRELLAKVGVDSKSTEIILDTILFANKRGNATHGIGRLSLYVNKIRAGHFNPRDEVEVLKDFGAVALLDAHNGFGQVAGYHAMSIALKKVEEYGVAAVGVRNSNNFGMAGYYGNMAAEKGYAALVFANAAPAIAPTGGTKPIFGTNPLCFAFPGNINHNPILLDMATTVAARGKIRLAAKNGEKIPLDWAINADGQPTDDPNEALKGTLLPFGGYKGYGLSLFVDLFAGLLTGSPFAGNVNNLGLMDKNSGNGHLFIVMDTKAFLSEEEINSRIDYFHEAVKQCGEPGAVLLPGERGYSSYKDHECYVELSPKQVEEINQLACNMGIARRLVNGNQ